MRILYLKDVWCEEDLKEQYRRLVKKYHPDRGGSNEIMKHINYEYSRYLKIFKYKPQTLKDVKVGCTIYVNKSKCVVTEVSQETFKARSIETKREAYFSKSTGFAMLNYKFKASVQLV